MKLILLTLFLAATIIPKASANAVDTAMAVNHACHVIDMKVLASELQQQQQRQEYNTYRGNYDRGSWQQNGCRLVWNPCYGRWELR